MKIKNKIFSFLSIFILIFAIFSFDFWLKNIQIFLNFSKENQIQNYNKSLFLSKNSDFSGAIEILPKKLENFEADRLELEGDIFYKLNYSTGEILEKYKNANFIQKTDRIEKKIAFLENNFEEKNSPNSEENEQKNEENSENNENENNSSKSEEEKILEKNLEKIITEQTDRKQFLNNYRMQESDYNAEIERLKNIVSENNSAIKKDW